MLKAVKAANQDSELSSQRNPGERLDGACRGDVLFPVLAYQYPSGADLAGQLRRAVAGHGQPRAVLRPVRAKQPKTAMALGLSPRPGAQVLLPVLAGVRKR